MAGAVRREIIGRQLFSESCPFQLPTGGVDNVLHIQHKQIMTFKCDTHGGVKIAIVPSPLGAVGVGDALAITGNIAWSLHDNAGNLVDLFNHLGTSTPAKFQPLVAGEGYLNDIPAAGLYPILPYAEWQGGGQPWSPISAGGQGDNIEPSAFRVCRQLWKLSYTGAALYAQGQVAVCQQLVESEKVVPNVVTNFNFLSGTNIVNATDIEVLSGGAVASSFDEVATAPGARLYAVQPGVTLQGAKFPNSGEWRAWRELTTPVIVQEVASDANNRLVAMPLFAQLIRAARATGQNDPALGVNGAAPAPGLGAMPVTFIAAEGLSANPAGSFVLEVVTDVEYKVMVRSPVRRFLQPPQDHSEPAMQVIAEVAKTTPAAVEVPQGGSFIDTIGNALGWYANTMGKITGTVWGTGGRVLEAVGLFPKFGKTMATLGDIVNGTGRLAIE